MVQHFNIFVYGRVQGVGFRYQARKAANSAGITGFVRNQADGSVYIEIEGAPLNCQAFIDWCRRGPDFGRVDHIDLSESEIKHYKDFSIRR